MNNGLAENIYICNNTIFCANSPDRTGTLLRAEGMNNRVFQNNIVVSAWSRPRAITTNSGKTLARMIISNTPFLNSL